MNRIATAALLLILAGCVAPPPVLPHATKAEQQEATGAYMNCLVPYAKELDDGRSDAKTIAQAMRGSCQKEFESIIETSSRGENEAVQRMMRQQFQPLREEFALKVVLDVRHSQMK